MLREHFRGKLPDAEAFNMSDRTVDMLKTDLADAGIDYVNAFGKYTDFHCLRRTTGSLLAATGTECRGKSCPNLVFGSAITAVRRKVAKTFR